MIHGGLLLEGRVKFQFTYTTLQTIFLVQYFSWLSLLGFGFFCGLFFSLEICVVCSVPFSPLLHLPSVTCRGVHVIG